MADKINIKDLFSLLPVNTLKQLAQKHNVQTGIKAPSTMLKAELVQSLSDHYTNLTGTDLVPVQPKPLKINKLDIPPQFQEKKPLTESKKQQKQKDLELLKNMREQFKERGLDLYKPQQYKLQQEKREARSAQYKTKEKLEDSIKRRQARQEKAKEARQKKKEGKEPEKKEKVEKIKKDDIEDLSEMGQDIYNAYNDLLEKAKKLKKMDADKKGKEYYANLVRLIGKVNERTNIANRARSLTDIDKKVIDNISDKIQTITDDDDILDKFYE